VIGACQVAPDCSHHTLKGKFSFRILSAVLSAQQETELVNRYDTSKDQTSRTAIERSPMHIYEIGSSIWDTRIIMRGIKRLIFPPETALSRPPDDPKARTLRFDKRT
jgi:hypothetical protein